MISGFRDGWNSAELSRRPCRSWGCTPWPPPCRLDLGFLSSNLTQCWVRWELSCMLTGELPEDRKQAKAIIFRAPTAILINRVLFKVNEKKAHTIDTGGTPKVQLYVPKSMLRDLCIQVHESSMEGAHRGFLKCLFLMRQHFYADTLSKELFE